MARGRGPDRPARAGARPARFRTTQDVRLHPMAVETVELRYDPDQTSRARIVFRLSKATVSRLTCRVLRTDAEGGVASTAHRC